MVVIVMGFFDKFKKNKFAELNSTSSSPADIQDMNNNSYELLYQYYLKDMDELREMCNINGLNFEELAKENYVTSNLNYKQFIDEYSYYKDEFDADIKNLKSVISQLISRSQNSNNVKNPESNFVKNKQTESSKSIIFSDSKKETSNYSYKPNSERDNNPNDSLYSGIYGVINDGRLSNNIQKDNVMLAEMMNSLEEEGFFYSEESHKTSKSRR